MWVIVGSPPEFPSSGGAFKGGLSSPATVRGAHESRADLSRLGPPEGRRRRHVTGVSWVSDAIYGINDGLGAVFGIVSGVAGYTGGSEMVLIKA